MRCPRCGEELRAEAQPCLRCDTVRPTEASHGPPVREQAREVSERRQLTVLFCDLVGSSELAERLQPEDLQLVLRMYQERCAAVVRRHQGYVAQYLGDGLLVYFGYPVAEEVGPKLAVEAGLALIENVGRTLEFAPGCEVELQLRVGIHTGPVVIGEMGDTARPERLAVGATPNLAARVQSHAEPNTVLLSESTSALVHGYFECESIGPRRLRGFAEPVALYRVVARNEAATRLDAASRRGFSPLCGREREFALLRERWRSSQSRPQAVMIVGDAGIGKSRLVRELVQTLAPESHFVVKCHGSPYHQNQALYPIVTSFEHWAQLSTNDGPVVRGEKLYAALETLGQTAGYPHLAGWMAADPELDRVDYGVPSTRRHQQLLGALVGLFGALAHRQHLVLVVEDLQWCDDSTQQFLKRWLAETDLPPSLCLFTARPGFVALWPDTACEVIPLEPLDASAAARIAQHVIDNTGRQIAAPLLDEIIARAEGVPLFVEEIARALVELDQGSTRPERIPSSLQDSLMARLDRLGRAKASVQCAAVVGREIPMSLLGTLAPWSTADDLAQAIAAGLMYVRETPETTFVFRHALIREAAYDSLVKGAREDYHRRIADALVTHQPELVKRQPVLLAHHYSAGGRLADAVEYLQRAAHRALAGSAFVEAIELLQRGLELVLQMPATPQRDSLEIALRSALGLALISTRGYSSQEVADVYTRARELCETSGNVPLRVLYGVWAVHLVRSDVEGVHRLALLFERLLESSTDRDTLLVAHACLGVRALFRARFDESRVHLEAADRLLDLERLKAQHDRLLSEHGFEAVLSGPMWLAWIDALEGHPDLARDGIRRAERLAEQIEHPYVICQTAVYCATVARELRDLENAQRLTDQALALGRDHGLLFWHALAGCVQGSIALMQGQSELGIETLRAGLGFLDLVGSRVNRSYFISYLADGYRQTQQTDTGLVCIDDALDSCRASLGPYYESELLRLQGELLLQRRNELKALESFRSALALARAQGVRLLELRAATSLARLLMVRSQPSEAEHELHEACRTWPAHSMAPDLVAARIVLAEAASAQLPQFTP